MTVIASETFMYTGCVWDVSEPCKDVFECCMYKSTDKIQSNKGGCLHLKMLELIPNQS